MQKRWKCLWPLPFQHFFTIKIPMAWRVWMCISPIYRKNILLITPSQWNLKNSSFAVLGWHPPARRSAPATVDFSSFFSWPAPSYKIPKVSGSRFSSVFLCFPHFSCRLGPLIFWRLEKWYYFYQNQSMVLQQIHWLFGCYNDGWVVWVVYCFIYYWYIYCMVYYILYEGFEPLSMPPDRKFW